MRTKSLPSTQPRTATTAQPLLKQGATGSAVAELQRELAADGFSTGGADGQFGAKTLQAVEAFQRSHGLAADGIVGAATWAALSKSAPVPPATPTTPSEPALVKVNGKLPTYTEVKGTLWNGVPSVNQVQQGAVGDCFFLSSLASLAQRQPQVLQNAIKDNGNGTYTVKMFQPQKDGTFKPTSVVVDDKIPEMADGQLAYAGAPDEKSAMWVSIAEKAYAKLNNGYSVLDQGGYEGDAMSALTGKPSGGMDVTPARADAVYNQLKTAIAAGKLTTAGTYNQADINQALATFRQQGLDPSFDPKTFNYDAYGVVDSHAYTVTGVTTDAAGQKYVQLRNPWAETEPGNDGNDDGNFKMKLQDFCCLYEEIAIGG